jgi:hypothetical protein
MKRGDDIRVPALIHTLKTKGLNDIHKISSNLVETYLRPLLCRILKIPLDTQRSVDILNDLIDKKNRS